MIFHFLVADQMHNSLFPLLESSGFTYDYLPAIDREGIKKIIANYDGLIIRSKTFVDDDLLGQDIKLKVLCRAGAGIDNLDIDAIQSRNIHIINAPEGNKDAVAEHCMALLLNLFNNIIRADSEVRQGIWEREGNRGIELKNKTVAIIGYGNMGSAFAERLRSFGCKIIAYDKYKKGFGDEIVEEVSLDTVFNTADVISLHIPLTSETRSWIDTAFINKFKKPVYLLNTSRGEIISFRTIAEAMKVGKIAGAALDVLENEKLANLTPEQKLYFNRLVHSGRVIFTPHVGGWTIESYQRINEIIIEKLKSWLSNLT
jgi:D-3-phosphoglycerate dehydrogenase